MRFAGVVLAAGYSRRFNRTAGFPKHFLRIDGVPMICYPITSLALAGAREFFVVVSAENAERVRETISECPYQVPAELVAVEDPWHGNGYTALAGIRASLPRDYCAAVTMLDHIYPPSVASTLSQSGCGVLGVDSFARFVDYGEATKVLVDESKAAVMLGKDLESPYIDIGLHFLPQELPIIARGCPPGDDGEFGLSEVLTCAARRGYQFGVLDVEGAPWTEIDSFQDYLRLVEGPSRQVLAAVRSEWAEMGV